MAYWFNTQKSNNVFCYISIKKENHIISKDEEK